MKILHLFRNAHFVLAISVVDRRTEWGERGERGEGCGGGSVR